MRSYSLNNNIGVVIVVGVVLHLEVLPVVDG